MAGAVNTKGDRVTTAQGSSRVVDGGDMLVRTESVPSGAGMTSRGRMILRCLASVRFFVLMPRWTLLVAPRASVCRWWRWRTVRLRCIDECILLLIMLVVGSAAVTPSGA